MPEPENNILILGIGNILMNDEGIGIHVITTLEAEGGVRGADLMDGGTGGFHLLGYIQSYKTLIIIDASLDEHPAGHIRLLKPRYARDFPKQLSAHEIGLRDMMDAVGLLGNIPEIHLIAISVKDFQDMGMELSPEVASSIPAAARMARELVQNEITV